MWKRYSIKEPTDCEWCGQTRDFSTSCHEKYGEVIDPFKKMWREFYRGKVYKILKQLRSEG